MKLHKSINKKNFKLIAGKCRICGETEALDVHRIKHGKDGGKYHIENICIICPTCHRKVHCGIIEIDRYYLGTNGQWMLRIIRDGKEEFI